MVQTAALRIHTSQHSSSLRGTGLAQTEAQLLDNPVAGYPTLILRSPDFHSITDAVAEPVERRTPIGWWLFFIPSLGLLSLLGIAVSWLFWEGIGIWGLNQPVGWRSEERRVGKAWR